MNPSRTRHSKKILLRRVLFSIALILLTAAVVFLLLVVFKVKFQNSSTQPTVHTTVIQKKKIKVELPIRLRIPIIKVDAIINYVGLTSNGAMDIGPNPDEAAWYEPGPRPGEKGSAVIAGHYGWSKGKPAVFNGLYTLKPGDELSVIDEKGASTTFVVRESRQYNPDADASVVFKSYDDKAHLNLITCGGVWENEKATYSYRLVIFTDKKASN